MGGVSDASLPVLGHHEDSPECLRGWGCLAGDFPEIRQGHKRAETRVVLHVKRPLLLSDCDQNCHVSTDMNEPPGYVSNLMRIHSAVLEL